MDSFKFSIKTSKLLEDINLNRTEHEGMVDGGKDSADQTVTRRLPFSSYFLEECYNSVFSVADISINV